MEDLLKFVSDNLREWFHKIGLPAIGENLYPILLFIFCTGFLRIGWGVVQRLYAFIQREKIRKTLLPASREEVVEATKYYVPTKFQNISPGDEHEPSFAQASVARQELIPFFLNKGFVDDTNQQKYYLILADSGMGKSTFLINLYLRYQSRFWVKRDKMLLVPLGQLGADDEWAKVGSGDQKNTILLLDAFDEDPHADADIEGRMSAIINSTKGFKKIILTSRTQFFQSEADEPRRTNVYRFSLNNDTSHYFKKLYIAPFDDSDISRFLKLKFPLLNPFVVKKRSKARKIISLCPNLMVRPMLLSYIDVLLEGDADSRLSRSIISSSSDLYEKLIERWINRESNRIVLERRVEFKINMYRFSEKLSLYLFHQSRRGGDLSIYRQDIYPLAQRYSIDLSDLELRGKSLLNRDGFGRYKFAHKSILEYFLARHALENVEFAEGVYMFKKLDGFDQARKFYEELIEKSLL